MADSESDFQLVHAMIRAIRAHLWFCLLLCGTILCGGSQALAQRGSASKLESFSTIDEVIERWNPQTRLFVRGDVGVGTKQLNDLATWLETNGPHWTVVLMDQAADQKYITNDGRRFAGIEAVKYALGFGLSNRTGFGSLSHPVTQQSDGTVFLISLKDRNLSYFASDAQDARNLGEANWLGELDQPAIRAMRSGGRVLDAVKDTVTSINGKLSRSITNEQAAKVRVREQQERDLAQAQARLADLRKQVETVSEKAAEFARAHPAAKAPLATPPVKEWQSKMSDFEKTLSIDSMSTIERSITTLTGELSRYEDAYTAAQYLPKHVQELNAQIAQLNRSNSPQVLALTKEASGLIASAQNQMDSGSLDFLTALDQAEEKLQSADVSFQSAKRESDLAKMQAEWIRGTIFTMLGILAVIVATMLAWANRRRRAPMLQAIEALKERKDAVNKETDQLDKLFQRNDDILGSRESIEKRGYVGRTRQLALQALDYVDDLFIMSKEVKRVLAEAESYVHPKDPWSQFVNLISASRFQQAISHISGKPLKFSRVTGIPLIVRDMKLGQAATARSRQSIIHRQQFQRQQFQRGQFQHQRIQRLTFSNSSA